MTLIPDHGTTFWLVAVAAVFLIGVAKGGFAGGADVMATPLLSLVMPVTSAAALLLPLLLTIDSANIIYYRDKVDRSIIKLMLPPAVVGIALGGLFFHTFSENERALQISMGVIVLLFVLYQTGRSVVFGALEATTLPPMIGRALGLVAGFTSTLAHVGGPLYAIYVLPQKLDRQTYVGTTSFFFFAVNLFKLIPYGLLGLLRVNNLTTTLILIPVGIAGMRAGQWLNRNFSDRWFLPVIYLLLLLTGIQLLLGTSLIGLSTR